MKLIKKEINYVYVNNLDLIDKAIVFLGTSRFQFIRWFINEK